MGALTQSQWKNLIIQALQANSIAEFKNAYTAGSKKQRAKLLHKDNDAEWLKILQKTATYLSPHTAYCVANFLHQNGLVASGFFAFVEHTPALQVYLTQNETHPKKTVTNNVKKWSRDAALFHSDVFEKICQWAPRASQLSVDQFNHIKDVWWPSIDEKIKSTIAQHQPNFVHTLQAHFLTEVNNHVSATQVLEGPPSDVKSKMAQEYVFNFMGGERPFMFIFLRDHLQSLFFNQHECSEKERVHNLAVLCLQGEIYSTLINLQSWDQFAPLNDEMLQQLHHLVAQIPPSYIEHIAKTSELSFDDLLNRCQGSVLRSHLSTESPPHIRKM